MELTEAGKYMFGILTLVLLASGAIYISMDDKGIRVRVDEDQSTFYVKLLDNMGVPTGRWLVAGREKVRLFDGTSLIYRDAQNIELRQM